MYPESVIGIIFGTSLAAFVALGVFVLIGLKIIKGGKTRRKPGHTGSAEQEDESRMIQEIYRGLTRMEQRIDALEAILFDREKDGDRNEL